MQDIFSELKWRDLIHQTTADELLPSWLMEKSRVVYAGFDPTADSLHVGSLLPLMMLRRFQLAGHKPIAVVGGATGMIGDPSGKSAERNLLSPEQLTHNVEGLKQQMARFLDFDCGENSAVLVNNNDWMSKFCYTDFLRDVGKNFPVNVMLTKDSVKSRLSSEAGLSYTEFSYMLLQAYDFVHLFREFGCELQIGGSDQWGNVTAGIDLGRRMAGAKLFGLTNPLLTKADGTKMGKTESGAVWLSSARTSPYAFYQYCFNIDDADISKCLRFLTELSQEEVEELDRQRNERAHERTSQKALATELTRIVHGEVGLEKALKATQIFFGGEIDGLSAHELNEVFKDVPSAEVDRETLEDEGLLVTEALKKTGLSKSGGDARRAIEQGGGYVNNVRVSDVKARITRDDLIEDSLTVLRSGKKKFALLKVTPNEA